MRSAPIEKQTQGSLDVPSKNLIGKEHFRTVNEKVDIFNGTILNILSNFIPHEIIVCNDKEPSWFSNRIKTLIQEKNATYKIYRFDISSVISSRTLKYFC